MTRSASLSSSSASAVGNALASRVDDSLCNGMERPLGERRERPDPLDLVAEELDTKRLSSRAREHVDEPAADGDLSALLDALHALVARERELLHERVEVASVARTRAGSRPVVRSRRRHALGERARRDADDAARREHLECSRPLADEVRRGLEART